jgi:hypothetical protein
VAATLPVDPRSHESEGFRLFEMPVALYVACVEDPGGYDVIRVDAGTWSAGVRDVVDTQLLAHRGTVWVIDLPADVGDAAQLLVRLQELMTSFELRIFEHAGGQYAIGWRSASAGAQPQPVTVDPADLSSQAAAALTTTHRVDGLTAAIGLLDGEAVGPGRRADEPSHPAARVGPRAAPDRPSTATADTRGSTEERLRAMARRVRARASRARVPRGRGPTPP